LGENAKNQKKSINLIPFLRNDFGLFSAQHLPPPLLLDKILVRIFIFYFSSFILKILVNLIEYINHFFLISISFFLIIFFLFLASHLNSNLSLFFYFRICVVYWRKLVKILFPSNSRFKQQI
jgi:hypothetical protein